MSVCHVMILNELSPPILALYVNVFIKSDNINVKQGGPWLGLIPFDEGTLFLK